MLRILYMAVFIVIIYSQALHALEFSANAVMSTPGRADVSTQLYYSNGRMRKEFYYYGEPVIQILDANQQISLMCFTDQQVCYENQSLERINIGFESAMTSPCEENENLKCENLGESDLNQRKAIQWKIITTEDEQELVSYLWLDAELQIPVKQSLVNGTTIELEWVGSEKLGARETEKWMQKVARADGETRESMQWYDKELKISIRQSFPNGNTQELKHIVVEKLPDKLFTMPIGYEKRSADSQTARGQKQP